GRPGGARDPAAPRGGRGRGEPPQEPGPAGAPAGRAGGVPDLRRPDPDGPGPGVPGRARAADPEQPAERGDRLRVQGARAPRGLVRLLQRPPARALGRPERHPAADAPAPPRAGGRGAGGGARREGHRGGPRAVPGAHGPAGSRVRGGPGERGGHPHVARRHPGPFPGDPRGDGRGGRAGPDRDRADAPIDGQAGTVLIDPSFEELQEARTRVSRRHRLELELDTVITQPAVTPEGRHITLMGNVDLPEEIEPAVRFGAHGVGLLRTEFLLTGRTSLPSEEEQTEYFRRVALAFPEHSVIIRSFDLGGDKF